jgi:hypothetical protein
MLGLRRASWRATTTVRNNPRRFTFGTPPPEHEDVSAQELAEIERTLQLMEDGECAMGCDYPDGPMSPSGCLW